jgi:DNA-directed RNA polymerase subunit RPC12/RpoP
MDSVECPYCGSEEEIDHEDGHAYEEDVLHQQQCRHCEKHFTFYTHIRFSYDAHKADCLNDGEHDYKPTITFPEAFTEMECTMCGDKRELTNEERKELGIETTEEYWERTRF